MQPTQLDIFADSRDTMLRNDVLRALDDRADDRIEGALRTLRSEYPQEPMLQAFDVLANALRQVRTAPLESHDALAQGRQLLNSTVVPAARQALGADAALRWMAPLWRNLAQRGSALGYQSQHADAHAAPLWLAAADWANAADAVEAIESWRRIPAPLGWMAQARSRLDGLDATWPLLAELAWMAPPRFDATTSLINDPVLIKLRRRFDAEFEGEGGQDDLAWFPAWAVVDDNRLAPVLRPAQAGQQQRAERTLRAVLVLLTLERQGAHNDLVSARKSLRDLHPGLYAQYMQTR